MFIYYRKTPAIRKTAGTATETSVYDIDHNRFSVFLVVSYTAGDKNRTSRVARIVSRTVTDFLTDPLSSSLEDFFICTNETELSLNKTTIFNGILNAAVSTEDAFVDICKLNMALTVIDKKTAKVYCFSYNSAAVEFCTATGNRTYTKGKDGVSDIPSDCLILVTNGNSGDMFECLEIKISSDNPDEKKRLLLYTAQRYRNFQKSRTAESQAIASAVMKVAMDRTRQNSSERLSVCGTYTSSVRDGIRKEIVKRYPAEAIEQFVAASLYFAETGDYPQDSKFELMVEELLKMVPTLAAKRNPMFKMLDE